MTALSESPRPAAPRPTRPRAPRADAAPPAPAPRRSPEADPVAARRLTGSWRWEPTTGAWEVSAEVRRMLGIAAGENPDAGPSPSTGGPLRLSGLRLAHVHPGDRARVRAALESAARDGVPFAVETRVLRADGSLRLATMTGEPADVTAGRVSPVQGLLIDITDGRPQQAADDREAALQQEVEQLRTALASRAVIEQAKGVLMVLVGCTERVAFDLLGHLSNHTHRKVREVAALVAASASGDEQLPADLRQILRDACPPPAPARPATQG